MLIASTRRAQSRRASMSSPESSSSRIAIFGSQHRELQRLVALLLAARQIDVERAVEEALLEVDPLGLVAQHRFEVGRLTTARLQRLGHRVDQCHARHLGRILHDEVQPGDGALPGRHRQQVASIERDRTLEHLVARLAHHDRRQRALAGTVRDPSRRAPRPTTPRDRCRAGSPCRATAARSPAIVKRRHASTASREHADVGGVERDAHDDVAVDHAGVEHRAPVGWPAA